MAKEASYYTIIKEQLYGRGLSQLLLMCRSPNRITFILKEVHEGPCVHHLGGKALAFKVLRVSYYWPFMTKDSVDFVKAMPEVATSCPLPCHPNGGALHNHAPLAV